MEVWASVRQMSPKDKTPAPGPWRAAVCVRAVPKHVKADAGLTSALRNTAKWSKCVECYLVHLVRMTFLNICSWKWELPFLNKKRKVLSRSSEVVEAELGVLFKLLHHLTVVRD